MESAERPCMSLRFEAPFCFWVWLNFGGANWTGSLAPSPAFVQCKEGFDKVENKFTGGCRSTRGMLESEFVLVTSRCAGSTGVGQVCCIVFVRYATDWEWTASRLHESTCPVCNVGGVYCRYLWMSVVPSSACGLHHIGLWF